MRRKGNPRRLRGVALAEAAIVLMVLMMVTLGALQYGWFFYCLHTATNAARQGARVACVLDGTLAAGEAASRLALEKALGSLGTGATVEKTPLEGENAIQFRVTIPSSTARLMPIEFLPVPDCRATATMAKEG